MVAKDKTPDPKLGLESASLRTDSFPEGLFRGRCGCQGKDGRQVHLLKTTSYDSEVCRGRTELLPGLAASTG